MSRAFTLVEALITVAALAVVIAIITPNIGEAKRRTQSASVRANMQAAVTALEAYAADHNGNYPPDGTSVFSPFWPSNALSPRLTTPIAYMTYDEMADPFQPTQVPYLNILRYVNFDGTYRDSDHPARQAIYPLYYSRYGSWLVVLAGPDRRLNPTDPAVGLFWAPIPYDPTNGALSAGDIVRCRATAFEIEGEEP